MAKKYDLRVDLTVPQNYAGNTTMSGIQPGGTLAGQIHLNPTEDIGCRGVWLEIGYNEGGNGTPAENRLVQEMVYEGPLKKGRPFNHDFRFVVPEGFPVSYRGEYVKIDWYVRIRIDIPFWLDDRNEFLFPVIPKIVQLGTGEKATEKTGETVRESINVDFSGEGDEIYQVDI